MTITALPYDLLSGFVHNWLCAGPQVMTDNPLSRAAGEDARPELAAQFSSPELEITNQPVERGELSEGTFVCGDYQGSWSYYRCEEDHLVIQTGNSPAPAYLRFWAYTRLACARDMDVQLRLVTPGAADVWVGGSHLLRKDTFEDGAWGEARGTVRLGKGTNDVFVRYETLALGRYAHPLALQVRSADGSPIQPGVGKENRAPVSVEIPTTIMPRLVKLRNRMERLFAGIHLERDAFERSQEIALRFPEDETAEEIVTIRLMNPSNLILADGAVEGKPGMRQKVGLAFELKGGSYQIELLPRVWEYYEHNMRIKKDIAFWTVGNAAYSTVPYGSYAGRRQEGLLKAIEQRQNLFAEAANMALGLWKRVEPDVIRQAAARVNQRFADNLLDLSGLIGILYRFSTQPDFPADLVQPLEDCLLHSSFRADLPGTPGLSPSRESDQILRDACEVLAGQRHFEESFSEEGMTGREHVERGMARALAWLRARGVAGFSDWGSGEELSRELIALSLLVDLADDDGLQELATVVMDKIFFFLSLNLFQGIHGGPQRQVSPIDLKGGILQPTAPVARLMWGTGVFNHRIEAFVSLACMENYELPEMIANIATQKNIELWDRESHLPDSGRAVDKVVYRTADAMLASAQDYAPGETGAGEHLWQATLGPGAIVFTNHPKSTFTEQGMTPGFWAGNAVLPRVAQWKNSLVALYHLPEDDWMRFTHAYFPTLAFDEYALTEQWAFARKGDGYLAITCPQGFHLVETGGNPGCELRSMAHDAAWICHVGRAAVDGDFGAFQEKILRLPVQVDGSQVSFGTPQGDTLALGLTGPFTRNGETIALHEFPHFENAFTVTPTNSSQMDIVYGETVMRLDFNLPAN